MTKPVIVITGAGQRVGFYCALALQQQGYQLVISYRRFSSGVQQLQQAGVHCIEADFTELTQVAAFIKQLAPYPSIRAVIHNASSWQADLPAQALVTEHNLVIEQLAADASLFDAMQHIHVKVPYLLNRALRAKLEASSEGADIMHLTDFVASVGSAKHSAYAASKAALENLTFSLARQLAPTVKVNAIAPALLMFNEGDDEAYRKKALAKSLMQNEPGAVEVLNTITYLLNSKYITGRVLALDGGRQLKLP